MWRLSWIVAAVIAPMVAGCGGPAVTEPVTIGSCAYLLDANPHGEALFHLKVDGSLNNPPSPPPSPDSFQGGLVRQTDYWQSGRVTVHPDGCGLLSIPEAGNYTLYARNRTPPEGCFWIGQTDAFSYANEAVLEFNITASYYCTY